MGMVRYYGIDIALLKYVFIAHWDVQIIICIYMNIFLYANLVFTSHGFLIDRRRNFVDFNERHEAIYKE